MEALAHCYKRLLALQCPPCRAARAHPALCSPARSLCCSADVARNVDLFGAAGTQDENRISKVSLIVQYLSLVVEYLEVDCLQQRAMAAVLRKNICEEKSML